METLLKANIAKSQQYFFSLLFFSTILILFISSYKYDITICLYKNITGNDCYGCGMTRAILSIITLNVKEGIYYNWKVIILLPILMTILYKKIIKAVRLFSDTLS